MIERMYLIKTFS